MKVPFSASAVTISLAGMLALLPCGCESSSRAEGDGITTSAERSTRLFVQTTPSGATVESSTGKQAESPCLLEVPPGVEKLTIELELEGYQGQSRTVEIRGGRITRVKFELQKRADPKTVADTDIGVPETPAFGPVIERDVRDDILGADWLIDLDTARLHTPPEELDPEKNPRADPEKLLAWAREHGIDASGVKAGEEMLAGVDLAVAVVDDASWQSVTPSQALGAVKSLSQDLSGDLRSRPATRSEDRPQRAFGIGSKQAAQSDAAGRQTLGEDPPGRAFGSELAYAPNTMRLGGPGVPRDTLYAFRTREGGVGVLQVVGRESPDLPVVTIRYKLVTSAEGAASAGRLDLRIAPTRGGNVEVALAQPEVQGYIEDLQRNGAEAGRKRGDPFAWFPLDGQARPPLISATRDGQTFVLLANTPEHTMLAGASRPWAVVGVSVYREREGHVAVGVEMDDAGAGQLGALTESHLNSPLAILVNGRVVSAPTVRSKITRRVQIVGAFDVQEARELAQALTAGMVAPADAGSEPETTGEPSGDQAAQATIERLGGRVDLQENGRIRRVRLFHGTGVTDDGLECLEGLAEVELIEFSGNPITDAGLAHVKGLTSLEYLYVGKTRITDAGLAHLRTLRRLKWLLLDGTQIGDAGLAHLAGLADLEMLDLADTKVTDAGLEHLAGLAKLKSLNLKNTRVTDAGLAHLEKLTNLHWLNLAGTEVSAGAIKRLQQQLPDLQKVGNLVEAEAAAVETPQAAKSQIESLLTALRLYRLDMGAYPTAEQGLQALLEAPADLPDSADWQGPYFKGPLPSDPWGRPYRYQAPDTVGGEMHVWSAGPDGVDGTDDDIGSWEPGSRPVPSTIEQAVRDAVSQFVEAVIAGEKEAVETLVHEEAPGEFGSIDDVQHDTRQLIAEGIQPAEIEQVSVRGDRALAATKLTRLRSHPNSACVVYTLEKEGDRWLIRDLNVKDEQGRTILRLEAEAGPFKEVFLPDIDARDQDAKFVLDLASGERLPITKAAELDPGLFGRLGKGDLAYDRLLHCFRGTVARRLDGKQLSPTKEHPRIEGIRSYELLPAPCRLLVTTAEEKHYEVKVLSYDDEGLRLEYREAGPSVLREAGVPTRPAAPKEVHLPDVDTPGAKVVLDLASGEMLQLQPRSDHVKQFSGTGKGDLFFDRVLVCLRGATVKRWDGERFVELLPIDRRFDGRAYKLPALPCRLLVTTAEKRHFDVTIVAVSEDGGLDLEYRPATAATLR